MAADSVTTGIIEGCNLMLTIYELDAETLAKRAADVAAELAGIDGRREVLARESAEAARERDRHSRLVDFWTGESDRAAAALAGHDARAGALADLREQTAKDIAEVEAKVAGETATLAALAESKRGDANDD